MSNEKTLSFEETEEDSFIAYSHDFDYRIFKNDISNDWFLTVGNARAGMLPTGTCGYGFEGAKEIANKHHAAIEAVASHVKAQQAEDVERLKALLDLRKQQSEQERKTLSAALQDNVVQLKCMEEMEKALMACTIAPQTKGPYAFHFDPVKVREALATFTKLKEKKDE